MIKPLPFMLHPHQCVELVIYDNDGPEGLYHRVQFDSSAQAVEYIIQEYPTPEKRAELNFTITNYWKRP